MHKRHTPQSLLGKPPLPYKTLKNNAVLRGRWGHADKIALLKKRLP